jgi:hypothetical protein
VGLVGSRSVRLGLGSSGSTFWHDSSVVGPAVTEAQSWVRVQTWPGRQPAGVDDSTRRTTPSTPTPRDDSELHLRRR